MDLGLTDRDRQIQSAFYDLSRIVHTEKQCNDIGKMISTHFVLKQDVKNVVEKVIQLLKMWQCESNKFSSEEQQRLISLMNEQFYHVTR